MSIRLLGAAVAVLLLFEPDLARVPVANALDVQTRAPVVALTFDDGPDPVWTPKVLEVLERERVPATFFVLGPAVRAHPELVRRETAAGAEVGCHGWQHVPLVGLPAADVVEAFRACRRQVLASTGTAPTLVRPPYGLLTDPEVAALHSAGFYPVDWSVNALPLGTKDLRARLAYDLSELRPGGVVLLHDGPGDHVGVVRLLPRLIRSVRARGLRFVRLGDLIRDGRPRYETPEDAIRRYALFVRHHPRFERLRASRRRGSVHRPRVY